MLNVVLVEPEIPENTGNISRTCSVTGARLHLVRPLGFSVDDKHLKRAGLDYWQYLDITYYDSFEEVEAKNPDARFFLLSTHATLSIMTATSLYSARRRPDSGQGCWKEEKATLCAYPCSMTEDRSIFQTP